MTRVPFSATQPRPASRAQVPAAPAPASVPAPGPTWASKLLPRPQTPVSTFDASTRPHGWIPAELAPPPLDLRSTRAQRAIDASLAALNPGSRARAQAPGTSYAPFSVSTDAQGITHVRLDRLHEGVEVYGEQLITHLNPDLRVRDITGVETAIPAGLGSEPLAVSQEAAQAIASAAFASGAGASVNGVTEGVRVDRLIYEDGEGHYRNGYLVELTNLFGGPSPLRMQYMVDAQTGTTAFATNAIGGLHLPVNDAHRRVAPSASDASKHEDPPASSEGPTDLTEAGGDDTSMYSGKVELGTRQLADGTFTLDDTGRGKGVDTYDAQHHAHPFDVAPILDDNDLWGEATDDRRHDAAIDAHYGAQMTYDFLRDILGRDSIDGEGGKLRSFVHIGKDNVNAFWNGATMNYGDGDGVRSGALTTLDIAGHEIAHGLTQRTARLRYEGESGAINESMSDIIGAGVEWYAAHRNSAFDADWMIGEDAWTPGTAGDALRYMDDPSRDGYSIDHLSLFPKQQEVHGSSGIMNNAFYLLVEGGTNRTSGQQVEGGVSMDRGLRIFGHALLHYMTPKTTFAQARTATLDAAADLYGAEGHEVSMLRQAWSAVGVEDADD